VKDTTTKISLVYCVLAYCTVDQCQAHIVSEVYDYCTHYSPQNRVTLPLSSWTNFLVTDSSMIFFTYIKTANSQIIAVLNWHYHCPVFCFNSFTAICSPCNVVNASTILQRFCNASSRVFVVYFMFRLSRPLLNTILRLSRSLSEVVYIRFCALMSFYYYLNHCRLNMSQCLWSRKRYGFDLKR